MKNLFFVSVAFSIISGTSISAKAQNVLHFTSNQDLAIENEAPGFATSAPLSYSSGTAVLTTEDNSLPAATEMCTPLQFKYALILNREVESIQNKALYTFIDDWFGTRYRFGGTTKKGIDCSSLTGQLLKDVYNLEVPRTAREQYAASFRVEKENMIEGDLVFFNTRGGISHVGIFLGEGYFVHASSSSGVTISHLEDAYFKNRFLGAGRVFKNEFTALML